MVDGYEDRTSYARMNGLPAVSVSVTKRAGANIVEVADLVKELVDEQSKAWPEGVTYRVLADQSKDISDMVVELQNNILTALVLVVGVILFFMGFRNSLFVAFAIPLSMLISFMVAWWARLQLPRRRVLFLGARPCAGSLFLWGVKVWLRSRSSAGS